MQKNKIEFPTYTANGIIRQKPILGMAIMAVYLIIFFILLNQFGFLLLFSGYFQLFTVLAGLILWYLLDWFPIKAPLAYIKKDTLFLVTPNEVAQRIALHEIRKVEIFTELNAFNLLDTNSEGIASYHYNEQSQIKWIDSLTNLAEQMRLEVVTD